jgi:hypothetical protein
MMTTRAAMPLQDVDRPDFQSWQTLAVSHCEASALGRASEEIGKLQKRSRHKPHAGER